MNYSNLVTFNEQSIVNNADFLLKTSGEKRMFFPCNFQFAEDEYSLPIAGWDFQRIVITDPQQLYYNPLVVKIVETKAFGGAQVIQSGFYHFTREMHNEQRATPKHLKSSQLIPVTLVLRSHGLSVRLGKMVPNTTLHARKDQQVEFWKTCVDMLAINFDQKEYPFVLRKSTGYNTVDEFDHELLSGGYLPAMACDLNRIMDTLLNQNGAFKEVTNYMLTTGLLSSVNKNARLWWECLAATSPMLMLAMDALNPATHKTVEDIKSDYCDALQLAILQAA